MGACRVLQVLTIELANLHADQMQAHILRLKDLDWQAARISGGSGSRDCAQRPVIWFYGVSGTSRSSARQYAVLALRLVLAVYH